MLAIVIPYYKITFFEETLKSLANQSNKNFKVYIGDDASLYNPLDLLQKFNNRFDYKYKKFETNLGRISLTKHWNRCVEMICNEKWIMILGDDDILGENVVGEFYAQKINFENKYNVVRFASQKIDANGESTSLIYKNPILENSKNLLFENKRSSLSEYIFSKVQIENIGFKDFPLAWFSDVLAVLEFSNFKEIYSINESVVYVRISSESISGKNNNVKSKNKATFNFYYYLLIKKKKLFSKNENLILLSKLTKNYLNDKKQFLNFVKLSFIYLSNFNFIGYFKFIITLLAKIMK